MKNILDDTPFFVPHGRLLRSLKFVSSGDIKDKAILDVGCGYGWFEVDVLKRGAKKITGIEISEDDLKTVKKNIKDKKATFLTGSAIKLPFKDNTFDTVVCWEVIEHIPKDTEDIFFSEVYRVLKAKGSFYLSTPHHAFFSTYTDPAFWLTGHRHYTSHKLSELGKRHNLAVKSIHVYGGFWTVISLLNMYIAKWVFRRGRFFNDFFTRRDDEDYQKNGFYNIFVKYIKK